MGRRKAGEKKKAERQKGAGTLEKRGKIYIARWIVNGVRHSKSTGCTTIDAAEKKLAEFTDPYRTKDKIKILRELTLQLGDAEAHQRDIEDAKPALALKDCFESFRKSMRRPDCCETTMRIYERHCNKLIKWMKEHHPNMIELRDITPAVVTEFAADLANDVRSSTFNHYLVFFRCMWKTLKKEARLVGDNPWEEIQKKSITIHSRRELTIEELRRVCASLKGEMRILFAIGIYTGLRLGDCATLKWGNVDLVRRFISLIPAKTARHGTRVKIPIHPVLSAMLSETPDDKRTGEIIPETAQKYRSTNGVALCVEIRNIFESCGIQTLVKDPGKKRYSTEVGFHSLRHTFVSLAANAGAPFALVQSIVGHSTAEMTRHYFHENDDALKTTVDTIPNVTGLTPAGSLPAPVQVDTPISTAKMLAAIDVLPESELRAIRDAIDKRLAIPA